jgi:pimeloyl-ACP methyl ester carboxylesterase
MTDLRYDEWTAAQATATVEVDGHDLEVAYYDAGPREGDDTPVVFLHGIPTNSYLFAAVLEPIAAERRVILPDMVGYGQSSMHDGFDRSIRAQEVAVAGLLDELEVDRFDFVGHDLGGGVGLRLAAHHPDRIDRLVLSNCVAYDSWPIQTITDVGLPETARETSVEEMQGTLEELFRGTLYADEPDDAFVEAMTAPWNSEAGVVSFCRAAVGTNTSHTTEIDYDAIDVDLLLLWGEHDGFQPIRWAERLADDLGGRLVPMDANHWVPADRPDEFREELAEFLG